VAMGKKKCDEKDYEKPKNPKFECKKCGRAAKKEENVCKSLKISN
jgi:ubiquitin